MYDSSWIMSTIASTNSMDRKKGAFKPIQNTKHVMTSLTFTIQIKAAPEKVWHSLWDLETYKLWTNPFCQGSYYKTDSFTEGNKIHFLTPDGQGMYSQIEKIEPYNYLAFRHIGNIKNFEELPIDSETEKWTNAMETYLIIPEESGISLTVIADTVDSFIDYMNKTFPLALNELKNISENQ